ncbi:endo-1,3(4)-beta-glucanase 1 [[Candida] railenensis]|uniref:glucan endo-1,3-beta-D-glucosidase n=1 Tax=[Candida] railenensis TaxID=45579 RepID=A0A9P0VWR2_9ASCO|nr:endo-1,3(4)-beta-glucanase 1 [[Candida] railenensis]
MLFSLVPFLLIGKALANYTVTQTNYVTPDCFSYKLQSVIPSNEFVAAATTGFPVVFVYEDTSKESQVVSSVAVSSSTTSTFTVTSYTTTTQTITSCSNGGCDLSTSTKTVPYIYTITTVVPCVQSTSSTEATGKASVPVDSELTGSSTKSGSDSGSGSKTSGSGASGSKAQTSGAAGSDSESDSQTKSRDTSGSTTTSVIFSATSTSSPSSSPTSSPTTGTTESNPLVTQTAISQSQSTTIDTSKYTTGITIGESTTGKYSNSSIASTSTAYSGDLFKVIDTAAPDSVFPQQDLPLAIPEGVDNDNVPFGTNKFYANLFLGDQTDMIFSYPFGFYWSKSDYFGFGVQHTIAANRVHDSVETNNKDDWSYFYNPILTGEILISAETLTSSENHLFVTKGTDMSVLVQLSSSSTLGSDYIEIPVVQGMGFTTAIYHGSLTAVINSQVGFTLVEEVETQPQEVLPITSSKYRATLANGAQWLIYVTIPASSPKRSILDFTFTSTDSSKLTASESIDGLIIQYAVAPSDPNDESYYDQAAGLYVTSASVSGSVVDGTEANYEFTYETSGSSNSGKTILFALPHHVESMTSATVQASTGLSLSSTTKGEMYGYLANSLSFSETLNTNIQFLPWSQAATSALSYSAEQLNLLAEVANDDLSVDIASTVASMDSNYYSGKVIDKYAYILLVVNDILQDEDVAKSTLASLKDAFAPFIANTQYYPLMYDTRYGGVTSTASNDGDTTLDFGSGYYNDHHFHYGYFVHAAAIVGYVDKKYGGTWAEDNKDWVNSLIRDVANPSTDDSYFPVSRMFDWFAGHSWAAGLAANGDGKNEESSSEDYNFSYGMKLWGHVIGDQSMESRGDLMLAVQARAMNMYFLYSDDNTVEPSEYIGNKVSGILYDNKIWYSTFFGSPDTNPEYVHGIHMLPITPASSLIRGPTFVQQEWEQQVETFLSDVDSGWTGILQLNRALYDADSSYSFFSSSSWKSTYLDNGQSRTWSLAYSGGIANAN